MQLPSLTELKTRFRLRVDDSARGTDVPAGIDRGADAVAPTTLRERGRMRRRLRELRRMRDAQLLELGALVVEAHKHDRDAAAVIERKTAEATSTDAELRAVAQALDSDAALETIVTAGIAGPCPTCGTLASAGWRFCSTCGTPLDGRPDAAPPTDRPAEPTPLADARAADPAFADAGAANAPDADPADADGPTTELGARNRNGASEERVEATGHQP